ncbi:hypothetical protein FHR24_002990 [Wenyingzhuangia heitensis]|uniref:Uncharacterized protein n=1 Tax=Wenyingzhuangia heitensis TaxID=1487859 RepID=A0ABX0UHL0_9FLAO|nr:anti-phage protein KwaA [Wenyingzhuangia heitensis]NIJ46502.1 hypothetical protein [Wenyingzhuangia heitensis]
MLLKIQLYVLSLWLLFLLLFVNKLNIPIYFEKYSTNGIKELVISNAIPIVCLIFIFSGFLFYYKFKYIIEDGVTKPEQITEVEDHNWEHLTFLVTYVVPLLSFDLDFDLSKERNGLMFILILFIIGVIYVKTNIYYTNPTLALLGYHIYKVSTQNKRHVILITKDSISKEDYIESKHISDNVFFASKTNQKQHISSKRLDSLIH